MAEISDSISFNHLAHEMCEPATLYPRSKAKDHTSISVYSMPNTICLISPDEEKLLRQGVNPDCRHHSHVSHHDILIITSGGKTYPWRCTDDVFHSPNSRIDFRWNSSGDFAMLHTGEISKRHVVLREAREWRAVRSAGYSAMQLVSVGTQGRSIGNRYKIKCKQPRAPKTKTILHGIDR